VKYKHPLKKYRPGDFFWIALDHHII